MAIELHHLNTHGMMEQAGNVLDGVVRLKERIAELEEERRWRKCSDEMPSNGQEVLVWLTAGGSHGFVLTSTYLDSQWYYGEDPQGCKPSHWMPLPSAPKEDK